MQLNEVENYYGRLPFLPIQSSRDPFRIQISMFQISMSDQPKKPLKTCRINLAYQLILIQYIQALYYLTVFKKYNESKLLELICREFVTSVGIINDSNKYTYNG